jgi:DNA-binding PadR family transcriptional regulator
MTPIDFNGLDTAVHGPIRLGVLTALVADGPIDFTTLKQRLSVSDGAIGPQLLKLEEIGYLKCDKSFVERRPKSTYSITAKGRKALHRYLDQMQAVIDAVRSGE